MSFVPSCRRFFAKFKSRAIRSLHTTPWQSLQVKKRKGKSTSSQHWVQRQLNDHFAAQARKEGYRARSAYKLKEIDDKFKLLKPGQKIIDCGAAPGAWSQVAAKRINSDGSLNSVENCGKLVAIDLLEIEPITGVYTLPGSDFTKPTIQSRILEQFAKSTTEDVVSVNECQGQSENCAKFLDGVLSDMAPNATGDAETNHFRIVKLVDAVHEFAGKYCLKGSFLVAKIWYGCESQKLVDRLAGDYKLVKLFKPESSRSESAEIFVIAKGKKV